MEHNNSGSTSVLCVLPAQMILNGIMCWMMKSLQYRRGVGEWDRPISERACAEKSAPLAWHLSLCRRLWELMASGPSLFCSRPGMQGFFHSSDAIISSEIFPLRHLLCTCRVDVSGMEALPPAVCLRRDLLRWLNTQSERNSSLFSRMCLQRI